MIVRSDADFEMTPQRHPLHDSTSLGGSLDDFRVDSSSVNLRQSPTFDMPSQHSGFRSSSVAEDLHSDADDSLQSSASPWSPPAWRKNSEDLLSKHEQIAHSAMVKRSLSSPAGARDSREASPFEARSSARSSLEPDPYLRAAVQVPLPGSPEKQRSLSPSPASAIEDEALEEVAADGQDLEATPTKSNCKHAKQRRRQTALIQNHSVIRFSIRADVQHRTDPIESMILYWQQMTGTWSSLFFSGVALLLLLLCYNHLTRTPENGPGPDLIKVAGVARSFEPMIHYSESGGKQISQLQETSLAVNDLAESVRLSNMTSATMMMGELDELGESLKFLATELTQFFSLINTDVDAVLLVVEWSHRELSRVTTLQPTKISSAVDNLSNLAVFTSGGKIPHFSPQLHRLLGLDNSHETNRIALSRSFYEFLGTLEESVSRELKHALKLEGLFNDVDGQFSNLQRSIARETTTQDNLVDGELATLWTKLFGISTASQKRIQKFERNRRLLTSLREHTAFNRKTLAEHKTRLISLKTNIDHLRQRIASPLVKAENSSTAGLEEQIGSLEGTWRFLMSVRGSQENRIAQVWYVDKESTEQWPRIGQKQS